MNKNNLLGFIGTDQVLSKEFLSKAIDSWRITKSDGIIKTYYGDEFNFNDFEQDYQSPSLFSSDILILIKNVDKITLSNQKKILSIFSNPNPFIFIFVTSLSWKPNTSLRKWFNVNGLVKEFKAPWPNQIPQWILERTLSQYQKKITLADALLLWEFVGDNLEEIDQELKNLSTTLSRKKEINANDIQALLNRFRDHSFFELNKAVGLKQKTNSILCLKSLLEQGEPPFLIASRLFNHFSKLLKIECLHQEKKSSEVISELLHINSFIFKKESYLKQALTRSKKQWERSLIRLSELEWLFKKDSYTEKFEIEMVFFSLF